MSEVVVRMEMPNDCRSCPIAFTSKFDVPGWHRCEAFTLISGRPANCPIICQLPEGHGRLIDAEKLKAKKYHSDITHENAVAVAEIDWAETIVPAERSE